MAAAPALLLEEAHCSLGAGFRLEIGRFVLAPGEAVALAGPSGAGKSTMLDLLALARRPDAAGQFILGGRSGGPVDIAALWRRGDVEALTRLRAARFGYVLQQGGLLPYLSVARNIALSQAILGRPDPGQVREMAQRLGLTALLDRLPGTLSVGERQRVAIARALAHAPDIVLADEPTASVHPALADEVLLLLQEQARAGGVALVLATHDLDRTARHGFEILPVVPAPGSGGLSRIDRPERVAA
jgi:putative ABC transport system ATP-binding protein